MRDFVIVAIVIEQPFGAKLVAGDAWSWSIELSDNSDLTTAYTPDLYTLKYAFRGAEKLDLTATADPNNPAGFLVAATGAQTSTLDPGIYGWSMAVFDQSNPPNRTELARGTVEIVADIFGQDVNVDGRTWVKRSLDAIRAVLENRAGRIDMDYQINGRRLQSMLPEQLLKLEADFAARYQAELINSGQQQSSSRQIRARFV